MTHPILHPIGDHTEEHHIEASLGALRHEHVLGPAAAAEVELLGGSGARVAGPRLLVPERALVRDRDGRLRAALPDRVVACLHWMDNMLLRYIENRIV